MEKIILASGSERRKQFFRLMGLPFTCIPSEIDEKTKHGLSPRETAEELALQKTMAVADRIRRQEGGDVKDHWVFGADTIVVLDGAIYGKAASREAAGKMLGLLSGRRHEVITAMALYNSHNRTDCRSVSCEVNFAPLSGSEIEWYLDTGEWEDAAGAYQMQGLGGCLVKSISGSPSAVAGLPLHDFYVMLRENNYPFGG